LLGIWIKAKGHAAASPLSYICFWGKPIGEFQETPMEGMSKQIAENRKFAKV